MADKSVIMEIRAGTGEKRRLCLLLTYIGCIVVMPMVAGGMSR